MKILFVCTGNTCRSYIAQELFRNMLDFAGEPYNRIQVESAGIAVPFSLPASEYAVKSLELMGLSPKDHRSRQISGKMVNEADLILTMTEFHKNTLKSFFPEAADKVFTLIEYSSPYLVMENRSSQGKEQESEAGDAELQDLAGDIPDPFGGSLETYKYCTSEIKKYLDGVLKRLKCEEMPGYEK